MTGGDRRYDAIVVGAGPNGLSAAITLAAAGRSTLLVEASDRPGGAVRTEELTLPGVRHDVFSAVHPTAAASPVFAAMPLARHGLEWAHPRLRRCSCNGAASPACGCRAARRRAPRSSSAT